MQQGIHDASAKAFFIISLWGRLHEPDVFFHIDKPGCSAII
ncbi:hypothetical protein EBME_0656 [bacterium endosymbiont of Mortierella elongata FMR23-6]|nr:hypothetical protein EBME_0656 [bacterium endosymbiont of Mortierella elongata FMR23-6]